MLADLDETREFLALAAGSDLVAGVVGWVDLTAPGIADDLAALRAGPGGDLLVGVRHLVQGEADPAWLTRPDVGRGLAAVGAAGLAYDLLTLPPQLPAAVEAVRGPARRSRSCSTTCPKPPIAPGAAASRGRRPAPRWPPSPTWCAKLSGLVTEADHAAWTVARPAPVRGRRPRRVRPGAADVRLGLAGVPARRRVRRRGGGRARRWSRPVARRACRGVRRHARRTYGLP